MSGTAPKKPHAKKSPAWNRAFEQPRFDDETRQLCMGLSAKALTQADSSARGPSKR